MDKLIIALVGIVLFALAFFYGAFAWGYVMFKFWAWFVLPVFTNLPNLTIIQCVGLMMFISLFKALPAQIIKEEYVDETTASIFQIITPIIFLIVGWLVKIIIM